MSAKLMLLLVVAVLWGSSSGFKIMDERVEEGTNLVEEKEDAWRMLTKPKSKTSVKSIIKALQAYEARKKMGKEEPEDEMLLSSEGPTPQEQEPASRPRHLEETPPKGLHHHLEEQKHRYHHSYKDGWYY